MESAKLNALNRIQQNPVMVFSKSYCPYCKSTKALLDKIGVKYEAYEIDREESDAGAAIQDALKAGLDGVKYPTGTIRTVPQTYIGAELIGGDDALQTLYKKNEDQLVEKLKAAGAL